MDTDGATDEALLHALPERIEALEVLYERYVRAAMGLAVRMVRDRETAEEVVQEAFLSLWRHAGRYEPARGSVRTWLLGIVHHRAIDRLRGRPPTAPLPDELGPDPTPRPMSGPWPRSSSIVPRSAPPWCNCRPSSTRRSSWPISLV